MIGPMVLINGDIKSAIKIGLDFYARQKYAEVPAQLLFVHPSDMNPDITNMTDLQVKAANFVLPKTIWICREEDK